MIDLVKFSTDPAIGSAGTASASGFSPPVYGKVLSVHVQYNDNPPSTADLSLYDDGDPTQEPIVQRINNNVDYRCYPRRPLQNNTNADLTYDGTRKIHEAYVVHGKLKGSLTQVNEGNSATFTVWMER
ncbi:MAG: hypothetical protein ABFD51_11250 [Anaerolineaceae bacterium]